MEERKNDWSKVLAIWFLLPGIAVLVFIGGMMACGVIGLAFRVVR